MKIFSILFFLSWLLSGCGGGANPIGIAVESTIFIGDVDPTQGSFISNPISEEAFGSLTTVITEEFDEYYQMEVTHLEIGADFPGIGRVNLSLNPGLASTATAYKLNIQNNQPFGIHQMNLNLIIETPEQNMRLDQVMLRSDTALLKLAEDLPVLTFFLQGQAKAIDISSLEALIPSFLVSSTEDPT